MAESVIKNPSAIITETPTQGVTITKCGQIVTVAINKSVKLNGTLWVRIADTSYPPISEVFGVAKVDAIDKIIGLDVIRNGGIFVMGSGSDTVLVRGIITYITNT